MPALCCSGGGRRNRGSPEAGTGEKVTGGRRGESLGTSPGEQPSKTDLVEAINSRGQSWTSDYFGGIDANK